jgi:hypothetical protein
MQRCAGTALQLSERVPRCALREGDILIQLWT